MDWVNALVHVTGIGSKALEDKHTRLAQNPPIDKITRYRGKTREGNPEDANEEEEDTEQKPKQ